MIGCIGPRPKGNPKVFDNVNGNPAQLAFEEIYQLISSTAAGQKSLIVFDW